MSLLTLSFFFCLVCLKVFRSEEHTQPGLNVSSGLLSQLTQSFLLLASYSIFLSLLACVCLPCWALHILFYIYLSLPPFLAFFAYLSHPVSTPVCLNKPYEANRTTFCPSFPKSGCGGSNIMLLRCHWQGPKAMFFILCLKILFCPKLGKPVMRIVSLISS